MPDNVFRTPRNHSLKIGGANKAAMQPNDQGYDADAGYPTDVATGQGGTYKDDACCSVTDTAKPPAANNPIK